MQVETYEVEEGLDGVQPEVESEAISLIKSLGLEGQQELVTPREDGTTERIQYQKMSEEEVAVYRTMCPSKDTIESYSAGLIPLRVLQVIAHSKEVFDSLEIWHKTVIDPVLVGFKKNEKYLLARWGEELEDYGTLLRKTKEELAEKVVDKCNEVICEAQAILKSPQSQVAHYLRHGYSRFI